MVFPTRAGSLLEAADAVANGRFDFALCFHERLACFPPIGCPMCAGQRLHLPAFHQPAIWSKQSTVNKINRETKAKTSLLSRFWLLRSCGVARGSECESLTASFVISGCQSDD